MTHHDICIFTLINQIATTIDIFSTFKKIRYIFDILTDGIISSSCCIQVRNIIS